MTLTTTLPRAAQAPQNTTAPTGADDGRHAASASIVTRTAASHEGQADASARRPFADVLDAQQPADMAARAQIPCANGEAGPVSASGSEPAATGTCLQQALAQDLAAQAGADAGMPLAPAGTDADAGAGLADAQSDDSTEGAAADGTQPLLSLLMPTLFPTVMPPAPAGSLAGPSASGSEAVTEGAAPTTTASLTASALSGAVAADAAQVLSVKAQAAANGVAVSKPTLPTGDATVLPAAEADGSAWAGLQRWSAALMEPASTSTGPGTDHSLAMPANRQDWQQSLMQALGDRLQLQAVQRGEQARLHLMPPQLGRIEIDIRQQGGALQVQLVATHDEVRQQLRQIAEPLRQDLVQRHSGEVSVQVATGAQAAGDGRGRDGAAGGQTPQGQGSGAQRDAQRQPGRALADDEHAAAHGFGATLAGQGQA